jgi:hypothetical protein
MPIKKFIVFRIATVLALLIALGILLFLFYLIFSDRIIKVTSRKEIMYISALFFLLLSSITFQIQNLRLIAYIEKDALPWRYFASSHTFLLILNTLGTIGIGIILYAIVLEFYNNSLNGQASPSSIVWFCGAWFFSNVISIVGSLHVRTYLRIRQIRREQMAIESLGENEN